MARTGSFLLKPLNPVRTPQRGSCLWVTFERAGKTLARISSTSGLVRWGPKLGLEFPYPVKGAEAGEALFRPGVRGARLLLREGMEGELWAGSTRIRLDDLDALGLARGRGRHRWVRLAVEMSGHIVYRGLVFRFEYGPAPAVEARIRPAPVPARFRREILAREDRPFALLVWAIYVAFLIGSIFLATRPIPRILAPDAIPRRFARLIYEAPQARTRIRQEIIRKREAGQAKPAPKKEPPKPKPEKQPEERKKPEEPSKPEEPRKPEEPKKPEPGPIEPETASQPEPRPELAKKEAEPEPPPKAPEPAAPVSPAQRAEQIRESVRGKGLLGVLTGRGSASISRSGGSTLPGGSSAEDLDRVLARVEGLRRGPEPSRPAAGGTGLAGPAAVQPLSRRVEQAARAAAAATPTPPPLEERQAQKVEAGESNEPQDSFSLKEATAAINRAVAAYTGGLRYLYNKALRKDPDLEGKLTVSITIAPNGTVAECHAVDSTLHAPDLEKAVLERIRRWTFPPVSSRPVTVTYPFVFFPTM